MRRGNIHVHIYWSLSMIDLFEISEFEEIKPPKISDILVNIPYDPEIFLWKKTITRWRKSTDGFVRDYEGEADWHEMARYVNKTYKEVFMETYNTYQTCSQARES